MNVTIDLAKKHLKDIPENLGVLTADLIKVIRYAEELESEVKKLKLCGVVKSLKEKEKPTFKEWREMYNYKKDKTMFVAHGKHYYYTEVYRHYQEWCVRHF